MYTRWNFELIKNCVENLGYILIDEELINSNYRFLILQDFDGYYYCVKLSNFLNLRTPSRFGKSNKYTCGNIILWCDINKKPFILISRIYNNSKTKLKWKCLKEDCGEVFEMSWDDIFADCGCPYCSGRRITISNCLATKNPQLAKEWHPTLNGNLTSYDVTNKSGKKVWWQCSKNKKHEWKATIYSRNNGIGCPYCSGKLPSENYNLLVYFPKVCEEWDFKQNEKSPEEYTPYSSERVWWICKKCNSRWKTKINIKINHGCPYCAGQKVNKTNCLANLNPELSLEWNYKKNKNLTPFNFTCKSGKTVWWQCKSCGHEWKARIVDRNNNSGCPICNESKGEKEISKYLSKIYIYNIIQKEFDELIGLSNGNLSYDFYLPQYNLLIEYQGIQHEKYISGFHKSKKDFEKQLEHDRRKKEYAINNNIDLLEIWYWDFDNIETILNNKFGG